MFSPQGESKSSYNKTILGKVFWFDTSQFALKSLGWNPTYINICSLTTQTLYPQTDPFQGYRELHCYGETRFSEIPLQTRKAFSGAPVKSRALTEPYATIKFFPAPDKCTLIRGALPTTTGTVAPLKGFLFSVFPLFFPSPLPLMSVIFFKGQINTVLSGIQETGSSLVMQVQEIWFQQLYGTGGARRRRAGREWLRKTKTWEGIG